MSSKAGNEHADGAPGTSGARRPSLPSCSTPASPAALRELRRCQVGADDGTPLPGDALPALLHAFRDPSRVRNDYPLVVARGTAGELTARPLGDVLPDLLPRATTQSRVVQDNLVRWERSARVLLRAGASEQRSGDARTMLRAAAEQMLAELRLRSEAAAGALADVDAMLEGLSPAAALLPLCPSTPVRLLRAVAEQRASTARAAFETRVASSAERLRALLAVEARKDPSSRSADSFGQSLGGGSDRFFDATALARSVGGHRGTRRRDPARLERLRQALASLERHLDASEPPALIVVDEAEDPCAAAAAEFDRLADALIATLRAIRIAELEERSAYEPERHDPRLAALDWSDCTADELHVLPVVAAVAAARSLASRDLQSLTGLLTSGRPVQVLATLTPAEDPAHGGDALAAFRLELGYLGVAFREAYVQQSTAARPMHLLDGLVGACAGMRPGLHVVDSGLDGSGAEPPLGAFLHGGAAIEGRAHLLFHYDPEAGDTFARRLDFAHNPAPEADWPESELGAQRGDGGEERLTLAFTFADFALLEPRLRHAFALVPDELASDELVPLAEVLAAPDEAGAHALPYVWIVTGEGMLQRALVRRPLVVACRDRLRFLRTLQELSGVRSDHVREAVARARKEAAATAERERDALEQRHRDELARVRDEAAETAMQGLARMLLELDPLEGVAAPRPAPAPTPAREEGAGLPEAAAAPSERDADGADREGADSNVAESNVADSGEADDDDGAFDEPWIESARCSTCNDCIELNPLMFVYDGNKQARIADPRAGTFAQLVKAAEKCPARCIHPGRPLDPGEPGLDELVARAAPFNP